MTVHLPMGSREVRKTRPVYRYKYIKKSKGWTDEEGRRYHYDVFIRVPTHIIGERRWLKHGVVTIFYDNPKRVVKKRNGGKD